MDRGKQHSFTGKYHAFYLLFCESYCYINDAIAHEKEIRNWRRDLKMEAITGFNPSWKFLKVELFGTWSPDEFTIRF